MVIFLKEKTTLLIMYQKFPTLIPNSLLLRAANLLACTLKTVTYKKKDKIATEIIQRQE